MKTKFSKAINEVGSRGGSTKFARVVKATNQPGMLLDVIYNRSATLTIPDPYIMELKIGGQTIEIEAASNGTIIVAWNGGEEFGEFENFEDALEFIWTEPFR